MPVGTYIYSLATTTQQAMKEAQLAIKKMNGYKVSYPVVYDIEYEKMMKPFFHTDRKPCQGFLQ